MIVIFTQNNFYGVNGEPDGGEEDKTQPQKRGVKIPALLVLDSVEYAHILCWS